MRGRLFLLIGALALVVAATASAARLDVIRGTRGPDTLNGTASTGAKATTCCGPARVRMFSSAAGAMTFSMPSPMTPSATCWSAGPGDVAYVIEHDPVRLRGCEQVIRLSPAEAASVAAANDDNG